VNLTVPWSLEYNYYYYYYYYIGLRLLNTRDIVWETKYKDMREGTKDVRYEWEKGTKEWVTWGREEKLRKCRCASK
jgi:hypothetical protein